MQTVVHDSREALADASAEHIASLISAGEGLFTLGLAGGSAAATYERLRDRRIEWERVDAWLSDERWVAPDAERSNGRVVEDSLMAHVGARFHRPIWGDFVQADDSAAHYEATIRSIHPDSDPDLIVLGMGEDGHTASLFPGTGALSEKTRWFVANHVPQQDELRLTATFPLLWRARHIIFLVAGEGKAEAVEASLQGNTPAGRVGDGKGEVTWHLDAGAASLLS